MADDADLARLRADLADLRGRFQLASGCLVLLAGGVVGGLLASLVPFRYDVAGDGRVETVSVRPFGWKEVHTASGPPGVKHDVKLSMLVAKGLVGFVAGVVLAGGAALVIRGVASGVGPARPRADPDPPPAPPPPVWRPVPAPAGPARPVVRPPQGPPPDAVELAVVEVRTIAGGWAVVECDANGQDVPWVRGGEAVELRRPDGSVVRRTVAGEEKHVRTRRPGRLAFSMEGPAGDDLAGVSTARVVFRRPG